MEAIRTLDRTIEDEIEVSVADEGTREERLQAVLKEILRKGYIGLN